MMYLSFLCVIVVLMFTIANSLGGMEGPLETERPCKYDITDLPEKGLVVDSAEIGNQSIQTLTFTGPDMISTRQRDLGPSATLLNSSLYFGIINNEVFVTTCPPVGEIQHLEMSLDENNECIYSLSVTVNPSEAIISASGNTTVLIDSPVDVVDVLEFTIQNEGRCTGFECSATFRNADVKLWIDKVSGTDTIRISQDDIEFGIVYQLRLSCAEMTKQSVADVNVIFIDGSSLTATAANSTASPAFLDKDNLSVCLVTTMTIILYWDHLLN